MKKPPGIVSFFGRVLVALGMIWALSGCGHKSALRAPAPKRLARPEDVSVKIECGKIALQWQEVFFNNRGEMLAYPPKYLVLRRRGEEVKMETPTPEASGTPQPAPTATPTPVKTPEKPASGTPEPTPTLGISPEFEFRLIAVVPGRGVATDENYEPITLAFEDNGVPGALYVPSDKYRKPRGFPPEPPEDGEKIDLADGYSYFYKIQAVGEKGITSEPSRTVEVKYFIIPGPPGNPTAKMEENGVVLTWTAPEKRCDGSPLERFAGYFIERSGNDDPEEFQVVGEVDDAETSEFTDTSASLDSAYYYRVRAFINPGKIPGETSAPVFIETTDMFAPEPPRDLRAAYAGDGVHLLWEPSGSPDTAGYRVYRGTLDSGKYVPLNTELLEDTVYVDATAESGVEYFYRVTAVDSSKHHNESRRSNPVRIRIP